MNEETYVTLYTFWNNDSDKVTGTLDAIETVDNIDTYISNGNKYKYCQLYKG